MHYYQFNIADYQSHTRHLTIVEDACYRRMLDWIYLHEKPLPKDAKEVARILILNDCLTSVEQVLNEYFTLVEQGWINVRAMLEIELFNEKLEKASKAGKASAEARKTKIKQTLKDNQQTFNERSTDVQPNKKQETLNNNHSRGSRLAQDWIAPQDYIDFCNTERPDLNANAIAEQFKDYWIAQAGAKGVKADWFATWRNWVRRQEASKSAHKNKSQVISDASFDDWLNSGKVAIGG